MMCTTGDRKDWVSRSFGYLQLEIMPDWMGEGAGEVGLGNTVLAKEVNFAIEVSTRPRPEFSSTQ